jgi:hypothetical protein
MLGGQQVVGAQPPPGRAHDRGDGTGAGTGQPLDPPLGVVTEVGEVRPLPLREDGRGGRLPRPHRRRDPEADRDGQADQGQERRRQDEQLGGGEDERGVEDAQDVAVAVQPGAQPVLVDHGHGDGRRLVGLLGWDLRGEVGAELPDLDEFRGWLRRRLRGASLGPGPTGTHERHDRLGGQRGARGHRSLLQGFGLWDGVARRGEGVSGPPLLAG